MGEPGSKEQRRRAAADSHRRASQQRNDGPSRRVLELVKSATRARDIAARLRATLDPRNPNVRTRASIKEHDAIARRAEMDAGRLHREDRDARWAEGAIDESVELARRRGEDIERSEVETHRVDTGARGDEVNVITTKSKPMKIQSGLEYAFAKGHLIGGPGNVRAAALLAAGTIYREAYAITSGQMSSRGEGGGGGQAGPQLRIIEAGDRLKIMRKGLSVRQRHVLDLVCGENMRPRAAADLLKVGFPAISSGLRGGLHVVSQNWADSQKTGQAGQAARTAKQRGAMLDGMIPKTVR